MALAQLRPLITHITMARSRFLYGLDKTPDDRLTWSPGGAALSPLGLAGKMTRFLGVVSHVYQNHTMPERPASPPPPPPSRGEAKRLLEEGFDRVLGVLEGVKEADLQQSITMPWGQTVTLGDM